MQRVAAARSVGRKACRTRNNQTGTSRTAEQCPHLKKEVCKIRSDSIQPRPQKVVPYAFMPMESLICSISGKFDGTELFKDTVLSKQLGICASLSKPRLHSRMFI